MGETTRRRAAPPVQHPFEIGGIRVRPGERREIRLKVGEMYTATPVYLPLTVLHGAAPGPRVFLTAAVHGNELNGIEIVRQVRDETDPSRLRGTLLLVGLANPIAFLANSRELPDGRDLNRVFPGRDVGSVASQLARVLFERVVMRSDYGIDLHTAGSGRTNLPHVRGDMTVREVKRIAGAFGAEIIFSNTGEKGTLRQAATKSGVATIVYESGEPLKFQKPLIRQGVAGVRNVLIELGMVEGVQVHPEFQMVVDERGWVRAEKGGIMVLNVKPGDIIRKGEAVAAFHDPFGTTTSVLRAPYTGLVVGASTLPMAIPGSAVCHLVRLRPGNRFLKRLLRRQRVLFE